ncbi:Alternative cyclin Pcl12 [Mycena indigotica]|uniref:Alternative cyclin Pcl12 n=1 Tax=Mycena indigotica TaxID=2126181 RepID=A0A8H6TEB1_9AGAR|nr:Alternative cyclin Pcl12 [Mycena indigotica]KAF7315161.1 Alternative cyclin Pcl12 [Mycena indigotica]
MSAYGALVKSITLSEPLGSTIWYMRSGAEGHVSVHHLTLAAAKLLPGLIDYLGEVMAGVVEEGQTYPQETLLLDAFEAYFFAGDVFIAIIPQSGASVAPVEGSETKQTLQEARNGRPWVDCWCRWLLLRETQLSRPILSRESSRSVHPRNLSDSDSRYATEASLFQPSIAEAGMGQRWQNHCEPEYFLILIRPNSVFNLVYANNLASVKLWERLSFTKAGLIPNAGRLRRKDGNGEEYVDAWVFYKSFVAGQDS